MHCHKRANISTRTSPQGQRGRSHMRLQRMQAQVQLPCERTSERLQNCCGRRMISEHGLVPKAMPWVWRLRQRAACFAAADRLKKPLSPEPLATSDAHSSKNRSGVGLSVYTAELLAMYLEELRSHQAPAFASLISVSFRSDNEINADLHAHCCSRPTDTDTYTWSHVNMDGWRRIPTKGSRVSDMMTWCSFLAF
jgi:hypothetical protein